MLEKETEKLISLYSKYSRTTGLNAEEFIILRKQAVEEHMLGVKENDIFDNTKTENVILSKTKKPKTNSSSSNRIKEEISDIGESSEINLLEILQSVKE